MFQNVLAMSSSRGAKYVRIAMEHELAAAVIPVDAAGFQ